MKNISEKLKDKFLEKLKINKSEVEKVRQITYRHLNIVFTNGEQKVFKVR